MTRLLSNHAIRLGWCAACAVAFFAAQQTGVLS